MYVCGVIKNIETMYAIEILKDRLEQLKTSYEKCVINGGVSVKSKAATDNKNKQIDLLKAIIALELLNEKQ